MTTPSPITLASFQRHIRDRYYATDHKRGSAATFLWFMEEVGELATALGNTARQADASDAEAAGSRDNLEEEFADVLAWLTTLANINDVDLAAAVQRKYFEHGGPEGHK